MAHRKAGGSTQYGRDSISKRLGVKLYAGQFAKQGAIIVRQRGTNIHPGSNVKRGEDDTLFATTSGTVEFTKKRRVSFTGKIVVRNVVNVLPEHA